uniref:Aminopeptidase n=1 Tax=Lymantria dispar TaxID=13123 RepID=Q95WL1_LYMDI|nr:aminopeptidase N3 [Lymantria dispar]
MMLPIVFCFLIGSALASPKLELRSNLEFLEYDSNLGQSDYRLTDAVYPHVMNVDLDVYLSEARFNGIVTMNIEVRESDLTQIAFHQKVVSILGVNLLDSTNNPVGLDVSEPFSTDSYYELLKINLSSAIPIGNYTLTVRYTGVINENPIDRGFYMGYYFLNNQQRFYATTQFQPYHARKAFPCFDEPMFKSQYTLSITRDSNLSPSYSNMAIAQTLQVSTTRVQEIFYPTPIISAYLVAFHVSDFVETELTSTPAKPFKIISRPGVTDQHDYAADIGLKITNELDDYLSIQYHEMGQGVLMKNDHIALPDFPSGAMENWGMVNYREAYLLYDQNNTNIINKIFIATIMAHELGHKWFGNLVTCFWWSNLWLNESFASYFEYFAAHWADPALELDDQFIVDYVHSALAADAVNGVTPMNWEDVEDNDSISAHFSTSSYAKGASVLRMMEHFVGARNFRSALRYYLREHAYEIGTPADMYAAFRRVAAEDFQFPRDYPNIDVGAVFDTWVENPGAPVLNVNLNVDTGLISVSQERYVLSGTRPNLLWQIPLTWTDEEELDFNTKPKRILTAASDTIQHTAGNKWVIFNVAQSGLYRVKYDDNNWANLAQYLKSNNRENIHKMNRAQIVNDLLYFIRSGDINQTLAYDVLDYLRAETDYYVWAGAIGQLDWQRRRFEHLPYANQVFTSYLLDTMETVIQHLGYEERATDSTSTILNRMQIMNLACNLNHTGCVADAVSKWRAYRENDAVLVPVNLRRYVYCVGLREGNASDYQFLFSKYEESENTADMVVILRALACTRDEASINDYLRQSMDNDKIRIHDRTNAWSFALQGNKENLPIVLNFLYENYDEMRTKYGGPARLNIVLNAIPAFLTEFSLLQQYQNWLYQNQVGLAGSFATGVAGVNTAMNNLNWGNNNVEEIYDYLLLRSSSTTFLASTVLLLAAMLTHLLR